MLFSQWKSPVWKQFPALLLHLLHPPALLSLPWFPCSHNSAGQKVTLSSAAPGAIYSHSGRARSSFSTKELLINNFHPTHEPSRALSDHSPRRSRRVTPAEREWLCLVRDRRGREKAGEQGWQVPVRVSLPSIWPFFTLLRRVASAVRCLSLPLLNFLFSSLPPTKNNAIFCFPATNVFSWQGPRCSHPAVGNLGKGCLLDPTPRAASPLVEDNQPFTVKFKSSGGMYLNSSCHLQS